MCVHAYTMSSEGDHKKPISFARVKSEHLF
jgi:hypothetical protein